jgi:hypothetical protein
MIPAGRPADSKLPLRLSAAGQPSRAAQRLPGPVIMPAAAGPDAGGRARGARPGATVLLTNHGGPDLAGFSRPARSGAHSGSGSHPPGPAGLQ